MAGRINKTVKRLPGYADLRAKIGNYSFGFSHGCLSQAQFGGVILNGRRERQLEGIAKVKADPEARDVKYTGRKPNVDRARILELSAQGVKPAAIAKELQVSRMTVWRTLEATN